jgi:hypothetical protein
MLQLSPGRAAVVAVLGLVLGSAACSSSAMMASRAMAPGAPGASLPLARSLFARDPSGQLTEDALQQILAAPIELDLPSRVGVLPIQTATDWRGPGPDDRVPAGVAGFVDKLRRDPAFSLVTQTMVIPSGALGMEALRENAARYRLRYLLLYREVIARTVRLDVWALGYATVVGALFLPGKRHEVHGYLEATMFDVKTGLLLFTTRRAVTATQLTNEWHVTEKLDQLAADTTSKFAPALAADVLVDLRRFAAAAVAENARRGGPGPAVATAVPAAGPAVAIDPR